MGVRLSEETKQILDALAKKFKVSKAKLLEKMLKDAAKQLQIDIANPAQEAEPAQEPVSSVLRFRVSEQERDALHVEAKERHSTVSEVLRSLIKKHLNTEKPQQLPAFIDKLDPKPTADAYKTAARLHISLSGREKVAIDLLASMTSLRRNTVVLSIVRAYLFKEITFTWNEMGRILPVHSELARIGRNINQMAKKLNTSLANSDEIKLETLQTIKATVENAQNELHQELQSMRIRWGITA